jgi:predicted  nucleic acid-binding Zn ribbon protein
VVDRELTESDKGLTRFFRYVGDRAGTITIIHTLYLSLARSFNSQRQTTRSSILCDDGKLAWLFNNATFKTWKLT